MLMLPTALKIYLAIEPVDMRKQFNGLWTLATERLRENPRQGAAFIFGNKDRDRIKILYWDGTGSWIFAKRLEKGRFTWPQGSDAHTSYWRRIQQGPRHPNVQAELGQTQVTGAPLRQAQGERWGM